MDDEKVKKYLESRENKFRKEYRIKKREGDIISAEYLRGHLNEIETLLFVLNGG